MKIPKTKLGRLLHEYIRDRAAVEGVAYGFDQKFFDVHLFSGKMFFFGVSVENGKMVEDAQEPQEGYFDRWVEKHGDGS